MLKYNKLLLGVLLILGAAPLFSQENLFFYYDSLTFAQYENKQWQDLTRSTGKALREDLDYYYMRMRAGIARYERQNYLMAEKHFRKAARQNILDPISREYIYYSKLYTGKGKEASVYYKHNQELLKERVSSKNKAVRNLYVDLAWHFNLEKDFRSLFNQENFTGFTGTQSITRNFYFGSFLMSHDISRYLSFAHGGSFLRKTNYYYYTSPELILDSYDQRINQGQYYASLGLHPGLDFSINASVHYVNYSAPEVVYRQRGYGSTYTIPGFSGQSFLSRFSVYKYIQLFHIGGGVSLSNLNNRNQFQKDASLVFYPLGNLNLYSISNFYHVTETGGNQSMNYPSFRQKLGAKMVNRLWIEAGLWKGEMKNIATNEGFVIYNANETMTSRYDLSFIIPDEKFTLSLIGSLLNYYSTFNDSNGLETNLNKLNFNGVTIIAELKWRF